MDVDSLLVVAVFAAGAISLVIIGHLSGRIRTLQNQNDRLWRENWNLQVRLHEFEQREKIASMHQSYRWN